MKTETTIQGLAASLNPARAARKIIGFVPTMGNLHEGHLTLVREAKKLCDVVVVSIFVNPTQFGPGEDFDNYPRTLEQDSRLLADVGCDIIFAPSVEQMYGTQPRLTNISVSQITDDLCGSSRPGHFDGVALVVTKLFNIVQPNYALVKRLPAISSDSPVCTGFEYSVRSYWRTNCSCRRWFGTEFKKWLFDS